MMANMALRIVILLGLLAGPARADSWISPEDVTLTSPNKRLTMTIKPAVNPPAGASATIGGKTFTLKSPWMPVDAMLFDDGTLLTLDDWHSATGRWRGCTSAMARSGGRSRWST
jgi:hypothetical protein